MTGPQQYPPTILVAPVRPTSGVSTASMVLGIVGLTVCLCISFGIPSILAVILGHVGYRETHPAGKSGRGQAVAGLVCGYVGLAPAVLLSVLLVTGQLFGGASS